MDDLDWVNQDDRIGKVIAADHIWAAGDYKVLVYPNTCKLYVRLSHRGDFETLEAAQAEASRIDRVIKEAEKKRVGVQPTKPEWKKLKATDFKKFKGDKTNSVWIAETEFGEYWLFYYGGNVWQFHFYKRKDSPDAWMTGTDHEYGKRELLMRLNEHYAKLQRGKPKQELKFKKVGGTTWIAAGYKIEIRAPHYVLFYGRKFIKKFHTPEVAQSYASSHHFRRLNGYLGYRK